MLDPTLAWEVLPLFPRQGNWTADEYLILNQLTNHYVELHNGRVEAMDMPSKTHQKVLFEFATRLQAWCKQTGQAEVVVAPYPLRINENTYREPDIVVALTAHAAWLKEAYAERADVVVEILSKDRNRDLVTKRAEYALAQISEYWLIDPVQKSVTVLKLNGLQYEVAGEYRGNQPARSTVLSSFEILPSSLPLE